MTEFKCDTRSHGNFLYGKKQSVFTVLYRLYNHCWAGPLRQRASIVKRSFSLAGVIRNPDTMEMVCNR